MEIYLRNLFQTIFVIFFVTFIPFVLLNYLTDNPAEAILRVQQITPTEENIASLSKELGLNKPLFQQYGEWIWDALHGDFGSSFINNKDVKKIIVQAFPYTLILALLTLVVIVAISFLVGYLTIYYNNHFVEKLIRITIFIFTAIPPFWLGLLLMMLFSVKMNWFPTSGYNSFSSLVLPVITLSTVYVGTYIRLIRNEILENKQEAYISFYKARNFSQRKINQHLIKNSLRSFCTSFSVTIPKLFAGSIVVENIFGLPGLGNLAITIIRNRDLPVLQAYIVFMAFLFILLGIIMDKVNKVIDPRLQTREVKEL